MMIDSKDIALLKACLDMALAHGASAARATLSRSSEDLISTLDGEVDKITHCEDSSIAISLFVDGCFGSYSTNKLKSEDLDSFIRDCCSMTRLLSKDLFRKLPPLEIKIRDAHNGDELGIYDSERDNISQEERIAMALSLSVTGKINDEECRLISEEGEYSDSVYDSVTVDTDGLFCRSTETDFDYGVEVTVEDADGEKYSAYWWTASPFKKDFDASDCGRIAFEKAKSKIGAGAVQGGKYKMVVSSDVASKFVSPIINALNGYSIQQKNSFLEDSLDKRIFPEGLTIIDDAHLIGQTGSKLFDSEGVATSVRPIIDKGTVKTYYINSYMSGKMGLEQTTEDATRPHLLPWPESGWKLNDILEHCRDGILVTDFNGGNTNSNTGEFSFGIEGFLFKEVKVIKPVSGMLVTGDIISLWKNMIAAGDDARTCMSKLIPTLAFDNVDFIG